MLQWMFEEVAVGLSCLAQAEGEDISGAAAWLNFLPFIFLGILFYIMLIRPERRRKEEHQRLVSNLKKHDRVVTIGGIYGMVSNVAQGSPDVTLVVDEGNNTKLRVQRTAITRVVTDGEAEATPKS